MKQFFLCRYDKRSMQNDANLGFDALLTYVVGYTQVLYFAASVTASGIHLLGLVAESNLL